MTPEEKAEQINIVGADFEKAQEILKLLQETLTSDPRAQEGGPWESNHLMLAAMMFTCGMGIAVDLPIKRLLMNITKLHTVMTATMDLPEEILGAFTDATKKPNGDA
jgi:hypothetical protein